jgi:hypothetical protein
VAAKDAVSKLHLDMWTGLNSAELAQLLVEHEPLMERRSGSGGQFKLTPYEEWIVLLVWLRSGFTFSDLADMLHVTTATASNIVDRGLSALEAWSDSQVYLPTPEAWLASAQSMVLDFPSFLMMFVDGTVLPIFDSHNTRGHRKNWSTKHNQTAFSFWILVQPDGRVAFLSKLYHGSTHDQTMWNRSQVAVTLSEFYNGSTVRIEGQEYHFAIGGDKAYPNIDVPDGWHVFVTRSGESADNPTSSNFHATPFIAKYRSVVERTIGSIKQFKALLNVVAISWSTMRGGRMVKLACGIYNWCDKLPESVPSTM